MSRKNAIRRRAYQERAQPHSRRKFGLLEKHKDYIKRAQNYHKKEETIRKLKEKAALRNPDEFYFKMINSKNVNGIHKPKSQADELAMLDTGYICQQLQIVKKKIEMLTATLNSLGYQSSRLRVYRAEDRKANASYKALEASKRRVKELQRKLKR